MNDQRLRLDLADLAEEVTPVDLRDRALRTSRRLGIRRAVASSAAVVVLLGAATGTAVAIRPDAGPAPMLPGGTPWATAGSSAPTPHPTPPAPHPVPIGRVLYAPGPDSQSSTALTAWQPGAAPVPLIDLPGAVSGADVAVSPDGARVAWLQDAGLWVAGVDGTGRRKLRDRVMTDCWGPAWVPSVDALSVGVPPAPGDPSAVRRGLVDLLTGEVATLQVEGRACHPVWSADGRVLVYADADGAVVVASPIGERLRQVPGLGGSAGWNSYDVASLSPDGSRVALLRVGAGQDAGDPARDLTANVVLDTRTGEVVDLPLDGRRLLQAYFRSDGSLVARVEAAEATHLVLVGTDGHRITEVVEPAALRRQQILAVVG
ncbi:TolB-like translocation protein [Micromonospora coxensis]|uniref:WD40-like Beta Propeller Repeat n=1 Tax=Micromonospora coxensis TaxID=356852 RepID=A0A1C5IRZ2_9ACTN|nr:hypothetical protein [Micromonospora coxensis]SCG60759.1 hypothetical protein GA0070614_3251 [Micromonospora coxensis]